MSNLVQISQKLARGLSDQGLIILSDNSGNGDNGVPLVAFRLPDDESRLFDEFALSAVLRRRGWVVPAYTMAPKSNSLKLMRVVIREDFTAHRCGILIEDVQMAIKSLEEMDEETIARYTKYVPFPFPFPFPFPSISHDYYLGLPNVMSISPIMLSQCDRYVAEHGTSLPNAHSFYGGEQHSLQGQTGKTHAVC